MTNRLILCLGLCSLMGLAGCNKKPIPTGPASDIQLGFITGLNGVTEPCGCTSKPLGGLDKMAAQIEKLSEGPFGFAVTGDTFFEYDEAPGHLVAQENAKGEAIAEILGRLNPLAVLPGPRDITVDEKALGQWAKQFKLPLFRSPRNTSSQFRADTVLHTIGGHKIGLIGIPGTEGLDEPDTITSGAIGLRAQGAEMVIALIPIGGNDAVTFVNQINAVDVAISGGEDSDDLPKVAKGTLVVNAGIKGKNLGLLGIHWLNQTKAEKGFVYNDEGKAKRSSLEKRITRLQETLSTMGDGPGKDVRQTKLDDLQKELGGLVVETPKQPYITWARERISKDMPAAKWATARMATYNKSLCQIVLDSTRDLVCPPVVTPANAYVGTRKCMTCHAEAYAVYEKTAHSHAWATLEYRGKTCDLGCIGCHTVGYEKPGGYCRLEDAEKNKNVGCENCHGPGAGHAGSPFKKEGWGTLFAVKPGIETCMQCHNEEHSDQFDFGTYLPRILGVGHGQ